MSKGTISTFELFKMFPDEDTAMVYLEQNLWPDGPKCPVCGLGERITTRKDGFYRCNQCKEDFTVRTGTIFERSHIPLHKWIYAMYVLLTARKGISSLQLSKEIGVRQASAWFMLHRIREACGPTSRSFAALSKSMNVSSAESRPTSTNTSSSRPGVAPSARRPFLGCASGAAEQLPRQLQITDAGTVQAEIHRHVETGSTLHTGEAGAYAGIGGMFFEHDTVNHGEGEFVRDDVTTNGVDRFRGS